MRTGGMRSRDRYRYRTHAGTHVFCEKHVYLLRLALIEHFVAFTNKNMQIEVFLMPFFVDASYQHNKVSK